MSKVITANDLRTGAVVYLDRSGVWVRDLKVAATIASEADRDRFESLALAGVEGNVVTAVYVFDVKTSNGTIEPISVRERIRASAAMAI